MPFSDYRTALVTGASSGIGAAVVERLAPRGARGPRRSPAPPTRSPTLAERTGCIPHAIDVSDTAALTQLAGEVEFDILVNNAGVDKPKGLLKADAADIDLLVDVNLRAVLHLCRLDRARHGGARPRPRRQHLLDRRRLQLRRQLDLPRHQGGGQHAVAAAPHRRLRPAGPRHRDLPGAGRHRHLRPRPRRQPGDPRALPRRLRAAGGDRHRRRHRLRHRRAGRGQHRPHGDHPDPAGARRPPDRAARAARRTPPAPEAGRCKGSTSGPSSGTPTMRRCSGTASSSPSSSSSAPGSSR